MNEQPSVPFMGFWVWLQALPLSEYIGFTWWFPLLESIHVLAISFVVGSILMVDLRLLGLAALLYPVSHLTRELVSWMWAGFATAAITGFGLFMTRASAMSRIQRSRSSSCCCHWLPLTWRGFSSERCEVLASGMATRFH